MNTGNHAPVSEVLTLKRMVDRHLSLPHEFVCITEDSIDGIETVEPINDLPGFWGKVNLFAPEISRKRNLWLDLDVTITRCIDGFVDPLKTGKQLRIALNWAQSGWGGLQSSVMYYEGQKAQHIFDDFDRSIACWPPRTNTFWDNGQVQYGDQEWCTYLRDTGRLRVEYFNEGEVCSYKYHCAGKGLPSASRVQVFHGRPNPGEVSDQWVKDARA